MKKIHVALIAVGAAGLWLSSRVAWLTVTTTDDKSGESVNDLVGAVWAPELTAMALLLIVGCIATLMLSDLGRRVVGVICAAAAIASSWSAMLLVAGGEASVDTKRALDLLTSGAASQRASAPVTVQDWAQVSNVEVHTVGAVGALVAAALALVGSVMLLRKPGELKKQKSSAYENPEVRKQRIEQDLKEDPNSGRVLWDALDAGVDPTEGKPSAKD